MSVAVMHVLYRYSSYVLRTVVIIQRVKIVLVLRRRMGIHIADGVVLPERKNTKVVQ